MDAAETNLIVTGIQLLLPQIPSIARAVEGLFGAGAGDKKLPALVKAVSGLAADMVTANKLPSVPDPIALTSMVETKVQQMIADGELPSSTKPVTVIPAKTLIPSAGKYSLVGTISPL